MKKRCFSLIELLTIIFIITIVGNMGARIMNGFYRQTLANQQQNFSQQQLKEIHRNMRVWCLNIKEAPKKIDNTIQAGTDAIRVQGGQVYFVSANKQTVRKIPQGYQLNFSANQNKTGKTLLTLIASHQGLSYALTLKTEGEENDQQ